MNEGRLRRTVDVLGAPIDSISKDEALQCIAQWAGARESRYVCICNAHSVVTASTDETFLQIVAGADMATPDGAPIAWMLRRLGSPNQSRVSGPDLMLEYLALAADRGECVFLYGSTEATLQTLRLRLLQRWEGLNIVGMHAPPFRPLTADEDNAVVTMINDSGAHTVWVGLGCPKQEQWMAAHRGRVRAVMIGVGAAFDFHAGNIARAPEWMRNGGLEWLHRLLSEPSRLWRRYLLTNTAFVLGAARQLITRRR